MALDKFTRRLAALVLGVHATALEARAKAAERAEEKAWDAVHQTEQNINDLQLLRGIQETNAELETSIADQVHADVTAELNTLPFINRESIQ